MKQTYSDIILGMIKSDLMNFKLLVTEVFFFIGTYLSTCTTVGERDKMRSISAANIKISLMCLFPTALLVIRKLQYLYCEWTHHRWKDEKSPKTYKMGIEVPLAFCERCMCYETREYRSAHRGPVPGACRLSSSIINRRYDYKHFHLSTSIKEF